MKALALVLSSLLLFSAAQSASGEPAPAVKIRGQEVRKGEVTTALVKRVGEPTHKQKQTGGGELWYYASGSMTVVLGINKGRVETMITTFDNATPSHK